jgi:hypothetical protein
MQKKLTRKLKYLTQKTLSKIKEANEVSARIQYTVNVWVPIYVFPEMKLKLLFPKQNCNVLSPSSCTHISVGDLYISRIGLPILLQGNMWTDPAGIYKSLKEIGTEAEQFPEKEYIYMGFSLQCTSYLVCEAIENILIKCPHSLPSSSGLR